MDWTVSPKVYVENIRNRDPAYEISAHAVFRILGPICRPATVTCRFSDEPDLEALRSADILIAGRLETALLSSVAKELKLIQCTSAGVETYSPFDWLNPATILTNASGVHAAKVGEFALMAALMLHERVPFIVTNQRHHRWDRQLRGLARGRRVLIYGVGALGGAVAERLNAFGFRVHGIRRSGTPHDAVEHMTTPEHFHDELAATDILILACPLTSQTRKLVSAPELATLPKGAGLLNISRGAIIDHAALKSSLEAEHLSGAILDVFEKEPLAANDSIWELPNLMVFPHVSADAPDGYVDRCLMILADNIARAKSGMPLRNVVDPYREY